MIMEGCWSFLQIAVKMEKDADIDILRKNIYANGYLLFGFNLTPDSKEDDHIKLIKGRNLCLFSKFGEDILETVNVIVHTKFQNVLEINHNKKVFYDFTA